MSKSNFDFLKEHEPILLQLAQLAESTAHVDKLTPSIRTQCDQKVTTKKTACRRASEQTELPLVAEEAATYKFKNVN